jgi:hypothetical protein
MNSSISNLSFLIQPFSTERSCGPFFCSIPASASTEKTTETLVKTVKAAGLWAENRNRAILNMMLVR